MENDFLPQGYEAPKSGSWFFKPQDKATRIRILSSPLIGYVDWDKSGEKPKPIRTKDQKPKIWKDEPKHFWALKIWNYTTESVQIRDITQSWIRNQIMTLVDWEWGDPRGYDLKVWKTWEKHTTEYFVQTTPDGKKEIAPEIFEAELNTPCDLEALRTGADPFESKWTLNS